MARQATSITILGAFLALAVFSFLGNPWLSGVFIVVAGVVLTHHAVKLCPRCSNLACAYNPKARTNKPDAQLEGEGTDESAYSDLPITRTTVVPLLIAGPLAVIGAWLYSPIATVAVAAVALTAHTVFRRLTCSRCGNDCAGNCNAHYRAWKAARRQGGG
jgi:hypothetical protein